MQDNPAAASAGTGLTPDALNVDAVASNQYRMADAPPCEAARSKSNVCRPTEYRAGLKSACDFCGHALIRDLSAQHDIDSPLLGYSAVVDLGVVQFVDTVEDAEAPNRPPNVRQGRSFAFPRPWRDA
ncbi:hypothetical protein MRX96_034684 [Rhipicephalus microplus]